MLLLLITGSAIVSQLRRGAPFGYGLLAAAVFRLLLLSVGRVAIAAAVRRIACRDVLETGCPDPRAGACCRVAGTCGMSRMLDGIVQPLCPPCGSPAAMERGSRLAEFREVRLPGRRRPPSPYDALQGDFRFYTTMAMCCTKRATTGRATKFSARAWDQQRPDVREYRGAELRNAGGMSRQPRKPTCMRTI